MEWEKVFANHVSEKELVSKINKELIQTSIKKKQKIKKQNEQSD